MSRRRKLPRDQRRGPAPDSAEIFAWAAQLHRAADLVEEYAAGRDMTVQEVLAEMPDGAERQELISLLSLPPVAARFGVPMGVIEISPGPPPGSHQGEAISARKAGHDPDKKQPGSHDLPSPGPLAAPPAQARGWSINPPGGCPV